MKKALRCPQCGSRRLYKDGLRYLRDGTSVQRYLCRDCGYRFSDPRKRQILKIRFGHSNNRQVGDKEGLPKNLASKAVYALAEATGKPKSGHAGATEQTADIKGKIVEFLWWMKKQGYSETTILGKGQILNRLVRLNADLFNPGSVSDVIARQGHWSPGRKAQVIYAYALFAKWAGINWEIPKISVPEKLPFIPLEREIDDLIAGCTKHVATALQIAKETGARVGEIFRLTWTDVDFESKTLRITPEKGGKARIFKMSNKLTQMLNTLLKEGERILSHYKSINSLRRTFERQRRKTAFKLCNPRLLRISFHTLRHWKATWEYRKTKDILYVMQILGHRNIKNTLKYTQLAEFDGSDEEFICKVAETPQQIAELIEAGFEYVCTQNGTLFFRKRK